MRHLIPRNFSTADIWTSDEHEGAQSWIDNEMHFDWSVFPEYWGSIHLIAPNPVFRGFHSRVERSTDGHVVIVAFELRTNKRIQGLDFEIESRRPTGTSFIIRKSLRASIERIDLPCEPEEMFERVHDSVRGLLYKSGPFVSNTGISMTMNLATETRSVSVPRADGSADSYEVSLIGGFSSTFKVGEESIGGEATRRLRAATSEREARNRGNTDQKWFLNQVADATMELRALVGGAAGQIFVVDPYFQGDDLLRVLLAVSDPTIRIDILAGAEHLRKPHGGQFREHGDHLTHRLDEAKTAGRMNPVEVRVMVGESPAIHDRFLLVGNTLWMLGSSLNAFGSRGTLLVKVPNPEPVLRSLRAVWNDCSFDEFSKWLAERRATRGPPQS